MFEMHYTGFGYPSMEEIEREAKERGFTHSYWASEYGYSAFYNGDVVVVFDSLDGMSELMKEDAMKYGEEIKVEPVKVLKTTWNSYDMRIYCMNRNFYTCGNTRQYEEMLKFVDTHEPTAKNVELVAIDIISHSSGLYSIFHDGDVDCIANEIWNQVVDTQFAYTED